MPTRCKSDIPGIITNYNYYFTNLWAKDCPDPTDPTGVSKVNWFDGAVLAVKVTFANYGTIIAKLPNVGDPPIPANPPQIDTKITKPKDLADALQRALAPQSAWIALMAPVTQEMDRLFGKCAGTYAGAYANAYLMIESLQDDLAATLSTISGAKGEDVCSSALQWLRTFFYWQEAFGMWEQIVADHCRSSSGHPPSPSGTLRVEVSQALVTVIQLPGELGRWNLPQQGMSRQIPPPKWPPWY